MVITPCSWNCAVDWAGILFLSYSAKPKQTNKKISHLHGDRTICYPSNNAKSNGPSGAALAGAAPMPCTHWHHSPTARREDALRTGLLLSLFCCWLRSFSVLPKALLFFRLSLTRDNLVRKVQVFKANVTIQAEELVTQRERVFEASTHFKWHLHSFLQFFCYKQMNNLILHSTEHLKSPLQSMNIWSPNEYRINPQGWTAKQVKNHPCYKSHCGNLAAGQLKPGCTSLLVL